jgi:hypothetical protein
MPDRDMWVRLPGMVMPNVICREVGDIEWNLRYRPDCVSDEDKLIAATIISAFRDLVRMRRKDREMWIRAIRRTSDA